MPEAKKATKKASSLDAWSSVDRLPPPVASDAGAPDAPVRPPDTPAGFNYGVQVRLQQATTGLHLHSHASHYPSAMDRQLVTCFAGESDNDFWIIQPATGHTLYGPVPHGALITLEHATSSLLLCSGQTRSHVAKGELEVFAAKPSNGREHWRVFFVRGGPWARLQHEGASQRSHRATFLQSRGERYPDWGYHQQEVTATDAPADVAAEDVADDVAATAATTPAETTAAAEAAVAAAAAAATATGSAADAAVSAAADAAADAAAAAAFAPPTVSCALWRIRPAAAARRHLEGGSLMRLGGSGRLPAAGGAAGGAPPAPLVLAKARLPELALGPPPGGGGGGKRLPHPTALRVVGARLRGPAREFVGAYVLVLGLPVNGRPAWRHVTRPDCWLAWNGVDAWLGQLGDELGEDAGLLELRADTPAPDAGGGWRAVGETNAWAYEESLGCAALGHTYEDAELAVRRARMEELAAAVAAALGAPRPAPDDPELAEAVATLTAHRHHVPALCGTPWLEWRAPGHCQVCGVAVDAKEKGLHCEAGGHRICWRCMLEHVRWEEVARAHLARGGRMCCVWASPGLAQPECECMHPRWAPPPHAPAGAAPRLVTPGRRLSWAPPPPPPVARPAAPSAEAPAPSRYAAFGSSSSS